MVIYDPEHGPLLSTEEVAALLGVSAEVLKAFVVADGTAGKGRQGPTRLPSEWLERARSRADVYERATGRRDMFGALEFWRAQRRDANHPGGAA